MPSKSGRIRRLLGPERPLQAGDEPDVPNAHSYSAAPTLARIIVGHSSFASGHPHYPSMRDITPLDELVLPRWEDAVVAYPWLQDSEEDTMTPTEWALLSQKERASWVVENLTGIGPPLGSCGSGWKAVIQSSREPSRSSATCQVNP